MQATGQGGMAGEDAGWLLYHAAGRFPGQRAALAAALAEATAAWMGPHEPGWDALLGGQARFLADVAALLGVPPASLFPAPDVTGVLQTFLDALPPGRLEGRRVLVPADGFPSLYWLLEGLAPRLGFELLAVPARPGAAFVEEADILAAWDERVGLAVLTWVTSTASHRLDIARLAAHGRALGSLVAADVTQGLGILPEAPGAWGCDLLAGAALKWLCGVPGAAFGAVRPALLAQLEPRGRGWFGKPDPFDWSLGSFTYAEGAARFGRGTPAPLAALASLPGVAWVRRSGVAAHRAHNLAVAERLVAAAAAHRVALAGPADPARRGGTVVLDLPARLPAAGFARALLAEGLHADARGQRLRLSPGICTAPEVAATLDAALGRALRDAA